MPAVLQVTGPTDRQNSPFLP